MHQISEEEKREIIEEIEQEKKQAIYDAFDSQISDLQHILVDAFEEFAFVVKSLCEDPAPLIEKARKELDRAIDSIEIKTTQPLRISFNMPSTFKQFLTPKKSSNSPVIDQKPEEKSVEKEIPSSPPKADKQQDQKPAADDQKREEYVIQDEEIRAIAFVMQKQKDVNKIPTIQEIADAIGRSRSTVHRRIREKDGRTPDWYFLNLSLNAMKQRERERVANGAYFTNEDGDTKMQAWRNDKDF